MIAKLRRRLIILVLAGLIIILGGTVALINYVNWHNLEEQITTSLQKITDNGGLVPHIADNDVKDNSTREIPPVTPEEDGTAPRDNFEFMRQSRSFDRLSNLYTITLDKDGNVTEWFCERTELYTDEDIANISARILKEKSDSGIIESQFYRVSETENGYLIAVMDAYLEMLRINELLRTTVLAGLLAFLTLGALGVLLIIILTKPVQESFDRQRQFVWDASHELKTPLAVISANADALEMETGDNEYLGYIKSEVRRTSTLVDNLLTLARMDQTDSVKGLKEQTAFDAFDISAAVMEVALPFESTAFEEGRMLDIDIEEGITLKGDPDMIRQLAVILLDNALKYSDKGGSIDLSLKSSADKCILRVHNTGPCIPEESIPHIFDRFYRADPSHNSEISGNGLGLSIAANIIQRHKATVTVDSKPDAGTTFSIAFRK